jgi:transposase
VIGKRCSRRQLLTFTANLQVQLIGMESCSGSHFLGRVLRDQGHEVRLMPAQYVKPYVQTNKSDYLDAEAIAEAVQRPRMRFVPIKSEEQLDLQALHRVRERWVMRRTAVVNQIRSLLLERGLTLPKGRHYLEEALPRILEDAVASRERSRGGTRSGQGARPPNGRAARVINQIWCKLGLPFGVFGTPPSSTEVSG